MRVLVTGATGFVGATLCEVLVRAGYVVRAAIRTARAVPVYISEVAVIGDIGSGTDWTGALSDVDFVVHLAARAHVMRDPRSSAELYFETNVRGTERLADAAAKSAVRRFINLSSIKAGAQQCAPTDGAHSRASLADDAYGTSKWLAEKSLEKIAAQTGLEMTSVRSPLIYGPGVRANFLRLMRWIDQGRLLPLGCVDNRRSMISVWNLCDLLLHVLRSPDAPGAMWMGCDGQDLSTPQLIEKIAATMGRRANLVSIPVPLLRAGAMLLGRRAEIERLCGSLTVDMEQTRRVLHWSPPVCVDTGLARTVEWYLSEARSHVD